MKLKNKISGEIKEFALFDGDGLQGGATLESLTKEWEDYEEPKDIWWLDNEGSVNHASGDFNDSFRKNRKIGNYFLSREEAEQAVERLRAWKRLKDKGFKISLKKESNIGYLEANWQVLQGDYSDVDICFGGEE